MSTTTKFDSFIFILLNKLPKNVLCLCEMRVEMDERDNCDAMPIEWNCFDPASCVNFSGFCDGIVIGVLLLLFWFRFIFLCTVMSS